MKKYVCVGESYKEPFRVGMCGETKPLNQWILCLYGEKGVDYFKGQPDSFILKYIKKNAGKRLEALK